MKKLILAAALAVPCLMHAPAAEAFLNHTTGTEITREQMDALVVGKTTRQEVMEAFGAPARREQLGDTQVWYYDYSKIKSFGKNVNESTVLEFNSKGILLSKSKSGSTGKGGNALLDAAGGK